MYDLDALERRITNWTNRLWDAADIEDSYYHRHPMRTTNGFRFYGKPIAPLIKRCNGVEEEE